MLVNPFQIVMLSTTFWIFWIHFNFCKLLLFIRTLFLYLMRIGLPMAAGLPPDENIFLTFKTFYNNAEMALIFKVFKSQSFLVEWYYRNAAKTISSDPDLTFSQFFSASFNLRFEAWECTHHVELESVLSWCCLRLSSPTKKPNRTADTNWYSSLLVWPTFK